MMTSLNKVLLIGNLTQDPQVRHTPSGTAVGTIRLAVNRFYRTPDGEKGKDTCFVDVVVWGRMAETCGQYLKKGRRVFVDGRLDLQQWEDKNTGQKRSKHRVVAQSVQFLDRPGEPSEPAAPHDESQESAPMEESQDPPRAAEGGEGTDSAEREPPPEEGSMGPSDIPF